MDALILKEIRFSGITYRFPTSGDIKQKNSRTKTEPSHMDWLSAAEAGMSEA